MPLAFVEGKTVFNGTGVATTAAFTNAFAVGQVVIVGITFDGGSNTTTSVTDNAAVPNTYTLIPGASGGNVTNSYTAVYWSKITTAKASPTVTVNYNSAATNVNVAVQYFNGFTTTPTIDQTKIQLNTTSTTATSGATSATGTAIELVVGIFSHVGATTTYTLGAGYTNLSSNSVAAGSVAMESLVTASAGAQTATLTLGATRINNGAIVTISDGAIIPPVTTNTGATLMLMGV